MVVEVAAKMVEEGQTRFLVDWGFQQRIFLICVAKEATTC